MSSEKEVDDKLVGDIEAKWGSVAKFKEEFSNISMAHFGSGWAWLVRDSGGELQVYSLPNQESPLSKGDEPIFNLDLWEHAYYLKYQNRRVEYIDAWWKVLKLIP